MPTVVDGGVPRQRDNNQVRRNFILRAVELTFAMFVLDAVDVEGKNNLGLAVPRDTGRLRNEGGRHGRTRAGKSEKEAGERASERARAKCGAIRAKRLLRRIENRTVTHSQQCCVTLRSVRGAQSQEQQLSET